MAPVRSPGDDNGATGCFDQWAASRLAGAGCVSKAGAAGAGEMAQGADASAVALPVDARLEACASSACRKLLGCRDTQYSDISRFLGAGIRHRLRHLQLSRLPAHPASVVASDSVNRQPARMPGVSTAADITPYRRTENRIQLSVCKIAQGMLHPGPPHARKD